MSHQLPSMSHRPASLRETPLSIRLGAADPNTMWLLAAAVGVFLLMGALRPDVFWTAANLGSMARQFPQVGLLALGILLAMLSGGIDLSMVGIANLSAILAALVMKRLAGPGASPGEVMLYTALGVAVALLVGALCGMVNGLVIAKVGVSPILATLGTMQLFTGIGVIITGARPVFGMPELFTNGLASSVLGVPVPALVFAAFAALMAFFLSRTALGTKLYLMGANPVAARFAGLNTTALQLWTYTLVGVLASCAGLLVLAQTNSAKADYGTSYTLQSILIAVMGGVNPYGGSGKVAGVVLALLVLQFLSSGFNILGFSSFLKDLIWGVSLLVVMAFNYLSAQRKLKQKGKEQGVS